MVCSAPVTTTWSVTGTISEQHYNQKLLMTNHNYWVQEVLQTIHCVSFKRVSSVWSLFCFKLCLWMIGCLECQQSGVGLQFSVCFGWCCLDSCLGFVSLHFILFCRESSFKPFPHSWSSWYHDPCPLWGYLKFHMIPGLTVITTSIWSTLRYHLPLSINRRTNIFWLKYFPGYLAGMLRPLTVRAAMSGHVKIVQILG